MAFNFFGKKNNKVDDETAELIDSTRGEVDIPTGPDPAAEKQRAKKIKNMKKKFDETVWNSVLDVMHNDMPQFVITEDPEDKDDDPVIKYVCLGFDTTIVDDFANKSDDDIGSIMTAIKSSMDCVIEHGLFDNELILFIPTQRTINALKEFEETFDLKFSLVYCQEDHSMSIETRNGSDKPAYVTFENIKEMLDKNIFIKNFIEQAKAGAFYADATEAALMGGASTSTTTSNGETIEDEDDEEIPSEVEEEAIPEEDEEEIPDEYEDTEDVRDNTAALVKEVVANAAKDANNISENVTVQKEGVANAQRVEAVDPNAGQTRAAASAASKLDRLKGAVQAASDEAMQDEQIKNNAANLDMRQRTNVFDMQAMDQYITRKYYSDDLGLEVSSEPFDAMFMQSNPYVPFDEIEGDNWLNGYVNNLRRDANARLNKLHQENLLIMRERFMLIITKHCESITKAVAMDDPKSRFGYVLKTITKIKNDNLAGIQETAEAYKREKEEDFQERMKAEMTNASNVAKANFMNRYAKEHERELREIETDLKNSIESEYIAAYDNLQNERRNEAKRQLDAGISEALKICADEYTKMLAIERKEYVRLQNVITDFQNENMASDEARIAVMSEEQRRQNEVVGVREEYDAKMALASQEFETKLTAVKAEIDRANTDHENFINELRNQHNKEIQTMQERHDAILDAKTKEIDTLVEQLDSVNYQLETLTQKYSELDDTVGKKYARQIDMLKSERDAWNERADHVEHLHKYTDKIKVTLLIVGVVAALGIGIIAGTMISSYYHDKAAAAAPAVTTEQPIIHYVPADEATENKGMTPDDIEVNVITDKDGDAKSVETTVNGETKVEDAQADAESVEEADDTENDSNADVDTETDAETVEETTESPSN